MKLRDTAVSLTLDNLDRSSWSILCECVIEATNSERTVSAATVLRTMYSAC
jgi:hypothetical protein